MNIVASLPLAGPGGPPEWRPGDVAIWYAASSADINIVIVLDVYVAGAGRRAAVALDDTLATAEVPVGELILLEAAA